jgi:hypothetical protein
MCDELCIVHYAWIIFQESKVEVTFGGSVYYSYVGLFDLLVYYATG